MNITKVDYKSDFTNPGLQIDYHWYNRDYNTMHTHNYWEFFIIYDGEVTHMLNGKEKRMVKNDLCLIRPSDTHKLTKSSKNYSQINFMATDPLIKSLLDVMEADLYGKIINHSDNLYIYLNDIKDELFFENIKRLYTLEKNNEKNKASIIKFLFTYLFNVVSSLLTFDDGDYPVWLNSFFNEIRKKENISKKASELCLLTDYSHTHLIRLLKKYTSKTLNEIIRDTRLNYALNLLEKTDFTVLYISGEVGYDSLSHFIGAFKSKFNYTPEAYRRLIRGSSKHPPIPHN